MKEIKLLIGGVVMPTPGKPVNLGTALSNNEMVRKNGMKIIWAASMLEQQLSQIITQFLFENSNKEKSQFFNDVILESDWFSFSAKLKTVLFVAQNRSFSGTQINRLEKQLRKIILLRNAFAHGKVQERSDGTYLIYFSNKSRSDLLDDGYWDNVMEDFRLATAVLHELDPTIMLYPEKISEE